MPHALHRSIIFWSGLLMMGFICWAWWDSMRAFSGISSPQFFLNHAAGGVGAGFKDVPFGGYSTRRDNLKYCWVEGDEMNPGIWLHEAPDEEVTAIPLPIIRRGTWVSSLIPHWLILLTVAAVWLGLLFWRGRRRKRVVTP